MRSGLSGRGCGGYTSCMQKSCKACGDAFEITPDDLAFYDKISPVIGGKKQSILPPTLCPDCRQQRRLVFRNERNLYRRTCDLCKKEILSMLSPDKNIVVYCPSCWWGDKWDAAVYGRDFDFSQPFFEQLHALMNVVPHIGLGTTNNENSEYVNWSGYNKNCYLIFASDYNEQCLYGMHMIRSYDCIDGLYCLESRSCHEVIDIENCERLFYSQNCQNCSDSLFLYDCKQCRDCLLCTNLRSKQYCAQNVQLTPQKYGEVKDALMKKLLEGGLSDAQKTFAEQKRKAIHRQSELVNCDDCLGNYLTRGKNLYQCFDLAKAQDCRYVYTGFNVKDFMDVCHCDDGELAYEGMSIGFRSYGITFANGAWTTRNALYVDSVAGSNDVFGCMGLQYKQYCIMNKQYTKEEYEALVPKMIDHMRQTGEWGEYLPSSLSPFGYNETMAQEYFPLTEEQAHQKGLQWSTYEQPPLKQERSLPADQLGFDSTSVSDDILQTIIVCEDTGKMFKLTKREIDFYKTHRLPLPHKHPDQRHRERMALRNPRTLWQRQCANCKKDIQTTYAPDRPEIVYCEECYRKAVY